MSPHRIATIADFSAGERGAKVFQHFAVASPPVLAEIAEALASRRLQMPIAATYALSDVRDAYRDLERGHTRGKIVLMPDELVVRVIRLARRIPAHGVRSDLPSRANELIITFTAGHTSISARQSGRLLNCSPLSMFSSQGRVA